MNAIETLQFLRQKGIISDIQIKDNTIDFIYFRTGISGGRQVFIPLGNDEKEIEEIILERCLYELTEDEEHIMGEVTLYQRQLNTASNRLGQLVTAIEEVLKYQEEANHE